MEKSASTLEWIARECAGTALQTYQQGLSIWPTPAVAAGLQAWFRADKGVTRDAGNKVSQWQDVSGHNLSAAQTADATRQPLWVAAATYGQPAVQFDGTTFLRTPGLVDGQAGNNDVTVIAVAIPGATQPAYGSLVDLSSDTARGFVVGQLANATNQFQLWFTDAAQSGWYSSPAIGAVPGATQVLSVIKSGPSATGYRNGVSQGTATVPAGMLSPVAALALGNRASGNYGYSGQIAEVLIYNRALSDTERQSVESALMTKYINPDADGNGLPDAWEIQYLGHTGNVASSDPGGVGRTILQSYQQGLSPWPTPAVTSGLRSWYQAGLGVTQDAANKVSQWTDLSGHGAHVVQSTDATRQPRWIAAAMNSQPAIQFDGATFLKTTAVVDEQAGSNDVTVITVAVPAATQPAYASLVDLSSDTARGFVVGQLAGATNQFQLWFTDTALTGWFSGPAAGAGAGAAQVVTVVKNGTNAASYLNGAAQGTATVPQGMWAPAAALALGNRASGNYGYNGQIAEVLVYNRALTDAERTQIETALQTKYIAPDADGNGLPDVWENQYLGHTGNDASSDPGAVGRTLLQSSQQGLSPWPAPAVASGLRSWFRASLGVVKDASNNVSQWTDLSGHGFHVTQTGALEPLFVAAATNSQPAVQFNGTTFLKTQAAVDETAGSNDLTVIAVAVPAATQPAYSSLVDLSSDTAKGFVVGQLANATNQFQLWFMDAAQAGWNPGPAVGATAGAAQVITVIKSGTNAASYLNSVTQGTTTVPAAMLDPVAALAVGNRASGSYGYNGQIAEVLVYNRALSDTERASIEATLGTRYGVSGLGGSGGGADSDGNGLPDAWELKYFGHIGVDPNADPDGDGQTNAQEFAAGTNPVDYYNGRAFNLSTISGGGSSTIAYTYDASGRITLADYAGGKTIQFTHDATSNLAAATSTGITGGGNTIVQWRTVYGLPADGTGPGADTAIVSNDGLPNLAKYAFGLNPNTAVTGDYPVIALTSASGSSYLTLTYSRPDPVASDLSYRVEVSGDNGATWASGSGATVDISTTVSGSAATVVVRDATLVGAPAFGRRIRLMIERRATP